MIVGQNTLLNQYVPTFFIKDLRDGQIVIYDSVRKAFINADPVVGTGGVTKLGQLINVSDNVDNPFYLQTGQSLIYNSFTDLWENTFVDYNTLLNQPTADSLLPSQTGMGGKALTTDGTNLYWGDVVTSAGNDTLSNKTLINPTIQDYTAAGVALSTATYTVDLTNGTDFEITTTGDLTVMLPAAATGKTYTITIIYGGTHTVTFAGGSTIKYSSGTPPTPTSIAGKTDIYIMKCSRAANTTFIRDGGRDF